MYTIIAALSLVKSGCLLRLLTILEADQIGITQTLRKHNLSNSVYRRWKTQFSSGGVGSLKAQYRKVDHEVRPRNRKMPA